MDELDDMAKIIRKEHRLEDEYYAIRQEQNDERAKNNQ